MSEFVRLKELLTNPEVNKKYFGASDEDITGKFIDYRPITSAIRLSERKTGFNELQNLFSEKLTWHPFLYKGQVCLVSSSTKATLGLGGETGYYSGIEVLNSYASLYSNNDNGILDVKAVALTRDMFENIKNQGVLRAAGYYWLADTYESYADYDIFGLYYAECGFIGKDGDFLFDSSGGLYYPTNQMRIVVILPDNIMVELGNSENDGSTESKALHLYVEPPTYIITESNMNIMKELLSNSIATMLSSTDKVLSEKDSDSEASEIFRSLKMILEILDKAKVNY